MFKKIFYLAAVFVLSANLYGCVALLGAAAGGAGTAYWLSNKLTDEVNASYDTTINATKKALKYLDLAVTKETKTEDVDQILSEYTDGRKIWIDIRSLKEDSTKIEIRVGVQGDEAASGKILEQIKKYL